MDLRLTRRGRFCMSKVSLLCRMGETDSLVARPIGPCGEEAGGGCSRNAALRIPVSHPLDGRAW